MRTIGMTAGWKVSRAFPTVVYIDAPRKRSNFGNAAGVAPFLRGYLPFPLDVYV